MSRRVLARLVALLAVAAAASGVVLAQAQAPARPTAPPQSPPVFKSTTDVIAIDVTVVSANGEVVSGLTPADFKLEIDGKPRRVVTAEWLRQDSAMPVAAAPAKSASADASSNETVTGGRLVLLVFDVDGIPAGGGRSAAVAASKFVEKLSPADQVGLIAVPNGTNVPFTADRALIRDALDHIVGLGTLVPIHQHAIGLSEAYDIENGNSFALQRAIDRECSRIRTPSDRCPDDIPAEAQQIAQAYRERSEIALRTFESLIVSLGKIDAPKTVLWISGGVPLPSGETDLATLSAQAATARTTVYAVYLDSAMSGMDAAQSQRSPTPMEDRAINQHGLEMMAGVTRGAVFSSTNDGTIAFDRIAREMAGYYLVGAESLPDDRDGKKHPIKLSVLRPGVTVRARREFVVGGATATARGTPEEEVGKVLQAPLVATELPLSVATYSLRAPGAGKVRVVVASDIGRAESASSSTSLGYVVLTAQGKPVASAFSTMIAELTDPTRPGALHASVAIDLPPGKYRLKLAVVGKDGRRGSVEHAFDASVGGAGGLDVADLMLTPPISNTSPTVRLTASPIVDAKALDAYIEIYGPSSASGAKVRVEVADSDGGNALTQLELGVGNARDKGRYIANGPLPLGLLPPGRYVARAFVSLGSSTVRRLRRFTLSSAVPSDDVFKNELHARVGAFDARAVLTPALLGTAVAKANELDDTASEPAKLLGAEVAAGRLASLGTAASLGSDASILASFLRGLHLYQGGAIEDAAIQFRAAIRSSPDFLPGVFYLGTCYAAGGRAREAIGAWQTALLSDDPSPDVYQLIAEMYLRVGDADEATGLLQEAGARWPDDPRFAITSALARAAKGHFDEALRGLAPWLERPAPGREMLDEAVRLAVADLAVSTDPTEAAGRMRNLAARLKAAGAETPPIVARWLVYLDASRAK